MSLKKNHHRVRSRDKKSLGGSNIFSFPPPSPFLVKGGSHKPGDSVASVPKFGSWDETDPRSEEGFTIIFNKVKQEKQIGSTKFPRAAGPAELNISSNHQKQTSSPENKVGRICFQQYEDPIEDENATIAELAATLQADLSQLHTAASFACRLGWAMKLIDPASVLKDQTITGYDHLILNDEEDGSRGSTSSTNLSTDVNVVQQGDVREIEYGTAFGTARVAFVVDANITSYLTMGSVSPVLMVALESKRGFEKVGI